MGKGVGNVRFHVASRHRSIATAVTCTNTASAPRRLVLPAQRRRVASSTIASLLATWPLDLVQSVESGNSSGPCAPCRDGQYQKTATRVILPTTSTRMK